MGGRGGPSNPGYSPRDLPWAAVLRPRRLPERGLDHSFQIELRNHLGGVTQRQAGRGGSRRVRMSEMPLVAVGLKRLPDLSPDNADDN